MPKAIQYKHSSVIYFAGDSDDRIFILQKGNICLTCTDIETGNRINENLKEGEFFGVKSALGHFPREETVTVMSPSVVIVMTVSEFEKLAGSNKKIMMKMLKVFSNQLRAIHKKTEAVLDDKKEGTDPEDGMYEVALAFYNEKQYTITCDICVRYLTIYRDGKNKEKAVKLYAAAKNLIPQENPGANASVYTQNDGQEISNTKPFFLPGFTRFAKTYKQGSAIIAEFEPGSCFYLIQSGRVQLVKCVNGKKKNLDILMPSEFFGEMAILENSPRSATCIAIDDVEVLEFNKENFEVLITGNPQIGLILLKLFCKRIYDQKRRFRILAIGDPQARVADVFLMLDETQRGPVPSEARSRRFNINIQEIAHWAGMSVEAVTDEINHFIDKRRLEVFDNYIVVTNMIDLRRFVDEKRVKYARPYDTCA